jgi:hypothetical protein
VVAVAIAQPALTDDRSRMVAPLPWIQVTPVTTMRAAEEFNCSVSRRRVY